MACNQNMKFGHALDFYYLSVSMKSTGQQLLLSAHSNQWEVKIAMWIMWILISLMHWLRKEICHQWRVTDEAGWGFGAICLYSSLTRLISLAQWVKDLAKANWGHDYLSPILSSPLISFLSSLEPFANGTFFWCQENEEIVSQLWHCLCLLWHLWSLRKGKVSLSSPSARLTACSSRDKLPLQIIHFSHDTVKERTKGLLAHLRPQQDGGHCPSLLHLSYKQMNYESHNSHLPEIQKKEGCHQHTLLAVCIDAKRWLCCLVSCHVFGALRK